MKKCKICDRFKELTEFYKISKARSHRGDGYDTRCKECVKERFRSKKYRALANKARKKRMKNPKYRQKINDQKNKWNRKKYSESDEFRKQTKKRTSDWEKTEHGKKQKAISRKKYQQTNKYKRAVEKYRKNNKHKRHAQGVLSYAIRSNKIFRPKKCSICHKQCTPEGHHPDYSEPLNVVWMCKQCHSAFHWSTQ